jgi:hypothetical protein
LAKVEISFKYKKDFLMADAILVCSALCLARDGEIIVASGEKQGL